MVFFMRTDVKLMLSWWWIFLDTESSHIEGVLSLHWIWKIVGKKQRKHSLHEVFSVCVIFVASKQKQFGNNSLIDHFFPDFWAEVIFRNFINPKIMSKSVWRFSSKNFSIQWVWASLWDWVSFYEFEPHSEFESLRVSLSLILSVSRVSFYEFSLSFTLWAFLESHSTRIPSMSIPRVSFTAWGWNGLGGGPPLTPNIFWLWGSRRVWALHCFLDMQWICSHSLCLCSLLF